jgi:hypothetical protein
MLFTTVSALLGDRLSSIEIVIRLAGCREPKLKEPVTVDLYNCAVVCATAMHQLPSHSMLLSRELENAVHPSW